MFQKLLIVLATIIFSVAAQAQPGNGASFDAQLAAGHTAYLGGNYQRALRIYESAKAMRSSDAQVYYFIGCAKAKLNQYDEAISTLKIASGIAGERDQGLHAKVLFMIAMLEEKRNSLITAKIAWNTYLSYVKGHTETTSFIAVAEDRIKLIEIQAQLIKDYAAIKRKAPGNSL